MVVFHFIYYLKFLNIIHVDIPDGRYWVQFRWVIVTLFFLCVGINLRTTHENGLQVTALLKGLVKTATAALAISVGSYWFIPEHWIFFGVLHFIVLSYVLALPFILFKASNKPVIALFGGVFCLIIGAFEVFPGRWPFNLLFEGLPIYTNDYVRIFPWFGMVLIGTYLGTLQTLRNDPLKVVISRPWQVRANWLSKHSLVIYLLHQPLLLGILYILLKVYT